MEPLYLVPGSMTLSKVITGIFASSNMLSFHLMAGSYLNMCPEDGRLWSLSGTITFPGRQDRWDSQTCFCISPRVEKTGGERGDSTATEEYSPQCTPVNLFFGDSGFLRPICHEAEGNPGGATLCFNCLQENLHTEMCWLPSCKKPLSPPELILLFYIDGFTEKACHEACGGMKTWVASLTPSKQANDRQACTGIWRQLPISWSLTGRFFPWVFLFLKNCFPTSFCMACPLLEDCTFYYCFGPQRLGIPWI